MQVFHKKKNDFITCDCIIINFVGNIKTYDFHIYYFERRYVLSDHKLHTTYSN